VAAARAFGVVGRARREVEPVDRHERVEAERILGERGLRRRGLRRRGRLRRRVGGLSLGVGHGGRRAVVVVRRSRRVVVAVCRGRTLGLRVEHP